MAKVTYCNIKNIYNLGHRNLINLIKNYDLTLEGPGLANVAAAIATGHSVATGDNFEEVVLVTNRGAQSSSGGGAAPLKRKLRQGSFPVLTNEKLASTVKTSSKKKNSTGEEEEGSTDPHEEPEAFFELELPDGLENTVSGKRSAAQDGPVKRGKKAEKTVRKKRLFRLLDEFDQKFEEKANYIRESFGRELNEKEEMKLRQERMEIVWDVLDDEIADHEDVEQARTIDEKYRYEEEMKAWKLSKDKENEVPYSNSDENKNMKKAEHMEKTLPPPRQVSPQVSSRIGDLLSDQQKVPSPNYQVSQSHHMSHFHTLR